MTTNFVLGVLLGCSRTIKAPDCKQTQQPTQMSVHSFKAKALDRKQIQKPIHGAGGQLYFWHCIQFRSCSDARCTHPLTNAVTARLLVQQGQRTSVHPRSRIRITATCVAALGLFVSCFIPSIWFGHCSCSQNRHPCWPEPPTIQMNACMLQIAGWHAPTYYMNAAMWQIAGWHRPSLHVSASIFGLRITSFMQDCD